MTTLIIFKNGEGEIKGRCDANCYDAKLPKCRCVCAGMNHGIGINQAITNTGEHGAILKMAQAAGEFIIRPNQYKLFEEKKP